MTTIQVQQPIAAERMLRRFQQAQQQFGIRQHHQQPDNTDTDYIIRVCPGRRLHCRGVARSARFWLRALLVKILKGRLIKPLSLDPLSPFLFRTGKCDYVIAITRDEWQPGRIIQCPKCGHFCALSLARTGKRTGSPVLVPFRKKDFRGVAPEDREKLGVLLFWKVTSPAR